jgi:serine/threonine-protein kinase
VDAPLWERLEPTLAAALDLPIDERRGFLATALPGDERLLHLAEGLLAIDAQPPGALDHSAAELLATDPDAPLAPSDSDSLATDLARLGQPLGRYRLLRMVGRGGMGTVYLAEREDGEYRQVLAIKILRSDRIDGELVERFCAERQILADLDHPYVARLFDGGTTREGSPFLVMEYVEGRPIDRYCEESSLSLEQRLRLFCNVADAVGAAHTKLVVHRDLKPANVLVTPDGRPKLLDFGIAQVLSAEAEDVDPGGRRLLTLLWASPEQITGQRMTTAVDVWGLGLLLFKLLTGRLPCEDPQERLRSPARPAMPPSETLRVLEAEGSGQAPDFGVPLRRARRRVRGDLDRIVGRALRHEPEQRYGSVREMAQDVRSYLGGYPVQAGPQGLLYRTGKLIRRHKLATAAVATSVLGLFAFSLLSLNQARALRRERDRVLVERTRAEQTADFLMGMFGELDAGALEPRPLRGNSLRVGELLDLAMAKVDTLDGQPDLQSVALLALARIYTSRGLWEEADVALRRALALRRAALGPDSDEVTEALFHQADLEFLRQNYQEAEPLFREVLERRRASLDEDDLAVAEVEQDLGNTLLSLSELPEAESLLRSALRKRSARLGEESALAAESLSSLGVLLAAKGDYAEAEEIFRRTVALNRRLLGDHLVVARELNNLAATLWYRGAVAEAVPFQREAIEMTRQVAGDQHPDLSGFTGTLALMLYELERYDEAESQYLESIAQREAAYGRDSPRVATALCNLGLLYYSTGRYDESLRLLLEGRAISAATLGEDNPATASCDTTIARLHLARGEVHEAASVAEKALAALRRTLPEGHWRTAYAQAILGAAWSAGGSPAEAEGLLEPALQAVRDQRGRGSRQARDILGLLAEHSRRTGHPDRAAEYDRQLAEADEQAP